MSDTVGPDLERLDGEFDLGMRELVRLAARGCMTTSDDIQREAFISVVRGVVRKLRALLESRQGRTVEGWVVEHRATFDFWTEREAENVSLGSLARRASLVIHGEPNEEGTE